MIRYLLTTATALLALASSASAALLTPAHEAQLEAWLGQGNLDLTNIYTKATGDSPSDFHDAVDGKGATFTLISIYGNGGGAYGNRPSITPQLIGGYNPRSWTPSGGYYSTPNLADRTAFVFNLSTGFRQLQSSNAEGQYQTYNASNYGPAFGLGDIQIATDLSRGTALNFSYGNTVAGNEIVSGGTNHTGYFGPHYVFSVADIEVYTFAPAAPQGVPDSASSFLLIGASLLGLAALRRRR
jgi:hypothetical protein